MAIYELEPRVLFDGAAAVATAEAVVAEMQTHDANAADSADSNSGDADSQNSSSDTQTPNPDSSTPATDSSQPSTGSSTDQTQIFIDTIIGTYDATTDGENILATPDNSELLSTDSGSSDLQSSHEVVFIDSAVKDTDTIVASLDENAEVVYINSSESGIEQITDYLSTHDDISSVQIFSEGNYAQIMLGDDVITADNIENYKDAISSWQSHLTSDADILFYGCSIAQDSAGQGVLNQIADWTGADVAASTDATGVQGDWDLEYATGTIEANTITVHDYNHNLETYTVTAITDSGDTSATGTLSWAINSSNATTTVDDTIAFNLTSGDTVTINGSETDENVLPIITDSVTIDGTNIATGNDVTVQVATPGSSFFRVFEINASGETVNIENMTIKGGGISDDGGGILIDAGTVNLDHVVVSNSTAGRGGGIYNAGTLTVTNSTISDNSALDYYYHEGGGGIYNAGTLTVITSTISGNSTTNASILDTGGGIYNKGTLTITDSTISDNSTTGCGAGIYNYNGATATITSSTISGNTAHEDGGGIANYGTLILTSSTISGNSATYDLGGGIYNYNGATATITSCTINGNSAYGGGGIANEGTTLLANTIIINNTATSSGGDIATSGTLNAYYCWYDASTTYGSITSSVGCTTTAYDSSLSSLADNGGYTMTMAASSSSTALNAGCWIGSYTSGSDTKYAYSTDGSTWYALEDGSSVSETVTQITTDQRGYYINSNVGISIGAYQYDGLVAKIGSATSWTTGVLGTDVFTTIQSAVNVASDTIYLAATSIMLSSTEVYLGGIIINSSVTLTGENGDSSSTIVRVPTPGSGGTASRVFYISVGTSTIENMTIQGGDISGESVAKDGGSIYIEAGTLNLDNVEISGANADSGGGIYIAGGTLTITDSTISNNSATHKGGGIYNAGTLTVINSTISGNATMGDNGGGIYNSNGTLTITSSTISDNEAGGDGGGIFNNASAIANITSSTISDNEASTNGGGIFNDGKLTITDSTISGNSSVSYGGGIFNDAVSIANITSSTISNNSSSSSGGGGIFNDGELTITDSTISGNTAATYGGGIYNYIGTVYVTNSIIAYNYKGTTGSYAYSDIYNLNGTIYGNYNISGYDLTAVGSGNQLYTYTSGKGDSLFASYTTIEADSIYVPVLADNGGNTYTVALASDSIAIGTGCYTGTYTSGSDTKYAYSADGNTWHAVEDGSSVTDTVTQITTDQRGETITGAPSIGAYFEQEPYYYFKSTASGGSWSVAATWTWSTTEEGVYTAATNAPTLSNSYSVTVVDGSTVTITSDVSITNLTVEGDLVLASGGTLDITDTSMIEDFTVNGVLYMAGGILTLSTGTLDYGDSSTLIYSASTAQNTSVELPSTGVANVIIDNSNGVTLTSNVSSISGDLTISSGTLQGTYSFTVDGNATINGAIGSTTALTSFTVNGTSSIGANITTTGTQTYTGAVTLTADAILAGSTVTFSSTLDGAYAMTVTGNAVFASTVGTTANLASLSVNGTSFIGANITTTGTQTYTGAVTLTADAILTGSTVTFSSTLDGAYAMTVTGNAVFASTVGTTANLASLSVNGTSFIGANITTTGTQTYTGAVTLTADAILAGSTVTFSSTLDGAYAMTVTGNAVFASTVGTTANLASLSVNGTSFIGANITTTGTQTYTGAVTLTADAILTGSTVTFSSTLDGAYAMTVTGNAVFASTVGTTANLASLSVNGTSFIGANITTTGTQTYTGAVTLTADAILTGSTVTFSSTLDGAYAMTVTGNAVFASTVGTTANLASLSVNGTSFIGANITTTGTQTYTGAVTLTADAILTGSTVTFSSTLDGAYAMTVTGNAVFASTVGTTANLASLSVNGTSFIGANITTTGTQTYTGAVTLTDDGNTTTFTTTNSAITFTGGVTDGTSSVGLTVNAGSAATTISSAVTIDGTLTKEGSGNFVTNGNDITTDGLTITAGIFNSASSNETWDINGNVSIGTSGTLIATEGTFTVSGNWNNSGTFTERNSTVNFDGAAQNIGAETFYNLTTSGSEAKTLTGNVAIGNDLTAGSAATIQGGYGLSVAGNAYISGAIGATSALTSVSISGTTNVGADITTTGAQSYTQTITLTNDITVKSGSGTITFTGSVQGNYTLDIGSTTQTGAIVFSSDVTITGLQTHSGAYSVSLLGNSSIDNAVTFSNTNGVVLGNASTDTLTFTSGVTSIVSTTSVAGTITASNGSTIQLGTTNVTDDATIGCNIVLGNVTIADGATLTLGDGDSGNITVASISGTSGGASSDIIINTLGVLTLGKVSTDIYNLSITVGSTSEITDDVIITGTLSKLGTGELKLQSDDMVAGKISLTGGTLTGGDYDWTISEDVTIGSGTTLNAPAILYVTGNWNNSGTFNHNNGEVRFEGDGTTSTISGANTFYDLSCEHVNDKTLTFTITDLQTVESWFTILGGDHQANAVKINNLYSSVNDYSVAFATVSGSNSLNKTIIASFSNNGGGNYNWRFEDFYEWDGSSDGDWNNPDNWTGPGGTPTSTSDVLINTQTGGYTLDISTAIIVEDFAILPGTSVNFTSNDGSITCNYVGGESVGFVNLGTVASDSGITVTLAVTGSDTVAMYSGIINSGGGISLTSTSVYLSDNISTTNYDISINANTAILRADVALSSSGGNITLSGTVLGNNHSLTIDAGTGDASLPTFSDTNRILNLSVTAGNNSTTITNNVYTDGTQTYTGHVVIGADVILDADDSDISFSGTVDADANTSNRTLTLDSGTGNITFSDAIGAAQAIDTLTITNAGAVSLAAVNTRDGGVIFTNAATGTITLNGNISTNEESTAGAVTIKGAVVLAADITIDTDSTTDGAISFTGTIDGAIAGQEYLVISGNTVFSSTIGATTSLEYLTVGGTSSIGGNVTTTGIQTYTGAVTLTNDGNTTTFATTNSAITFTGGITDGTSTVGLTVNSGSANTVISSTVTIDGTLTKEGSGNFVTNGNDITTGGLTVNAGVFNSGNSSGTWDINGDVSIASGATLNATSGTFTVSGSWSNSGTFDANGTTVTFDGSADQTISGTNTFYNLTIANTGDPSSIEVDASGSTSLAVTNNLLVSDGKFISATDYNNVSIASGAFLVLSGDITVSGNWSNSGTFTPGTYTVTLDGADQEISAETFYSLVSNGAGLKTLTGDVTIENALTLASGIFVLGSYNMTLQFTGNISGTGSSTNMIASTGTGKLRKYVDGTSGTLSLPVGTYDTGTSTASYSPVSISFAAGTYSAGAYVEISVTADKYADNPSTTDYLNRYWDISSSGITNYSATVSCTYLASDVTGTEADIEGIEYASGVWSGFSAASISTHSFAITAANELGIFTGGEAASLDHFEITTIASQTAGSAFSITITAYDQYGNINYDGTATLSDTSTTLTPAQVTFTTGIYTGDVTVTKAGIDAITVDTSTITETSNNFTVNPAAVDYVLIDPSTSQRIAPNTDLQFTAEAYDQYDNLITNISTVFTWSNANSSGLFNKSAEGNYAVNATYQDVVSANTYVYVMGPNGNNAQINDTTITSVLDDSTAEPSNSSSHPTYNFGVVTLNGIVISGNTPQLHEDSTSADFAKEDVFNPDTENVYDHKVDKPLNFDRTLMNDTNYDDDTTTGGDGYEQEGDETAMIFEQTNDYLAMIAGITDGESLYSITLDKHALFKTSTDIYLDAIVSGQV